jgi:hypothetical protein
MRLILTLDTETGKITSVEDPDMKDVVMRPPPLVELELHGSNSPYGPWTVVGVVSSYDLRDATKKYLRAVITHAPSK